MILLKNIFIISPGSAFHLSRKDILIKDGIISKVEDVGCISEKADIIEGEGLCVSSGWFDLHVRFGEPGHEYKEDLISGSAAAMQGGFTGVLMMPSTDPPVSGKASVEFVKTRTKDFLVDVIPAGTLSKNLEGVDLAEMYDMFLAGAPVFTDDKKPVVDAGLMTRALLYAQNFGGRIFSFADEKNVSGKGLMNEGISSVNTGLKGIPAVAEEIMINRELSLAKYTESAVHFSTVSTEMSVTLLRRAKAEKMKVSADVSAAHLLLSEERLEDFDSVYKNNPPLRTKKDIQALIEGLKDGTIDAITSDHSPEDIENKKKEFELAAFGMGGLETAFAAARTATLDKLSVAELVSKFTTHARSCAGQKNDTIEAGHVANLTIFNPDLKWKVEMKHILSKSKNNPFLGMELIGKAVAVINNGKLQKCIF
jgi:dihydroorotase